MCQTVEEEPLDNVPDDDAAMRDANSALKICIAPQ